MSAIGNQMEKVFGGHDREMAELRESLAAKDRAIAEHEEQRAALLETIGKLRETIGDLQARALIEPAPDPIGPGPSAEDRRVLREMKLEFLRRLADVEAWNTVISVHQP